MHFGRANKSKKRAQNDLERRFGVGAAVCAALGERKKDRGNAKMPAKMPEILATLLRNAILEL